MRLYYNTVDQKWLVKFPLQSSQTGWSDFVEIDRQDALRYVERQYEVIFL